MKLIDADELIESLKKLKKAEADSGDKVRAGMVQNAIYHADVMPVYEVVTCGECKEYQEWDGDKICMRLGAYKGNTKPTDFCSYGERRSDER